jgi:iron uptake system component EfeO
MRTTPARGLVAAGLLLGLTACGGQEPSADGAIAVEATDTGCAVARTEAAAGTVEFTVTNKGSKVNEFYLLGEGDQVLGEVENITPGLTRTFHVQVDEPGTYTTACKPGMKGQGIRGDFTVTGSTAAAKDADQKLAEAVERYETYVGTQADELLTRTTEFVTVVRAGQVEEAKKLFPVARGPWERIEPVAESFGDLDPMIDGREDVVEEGMEFTGYHRLEKDLWVDGLQEDTDAVADKLLADVEQIVAKAKAVELNPLQLANGSKALLDEVATGKITGEEDRYSHTDLYDFDENYRGCKAAIDALRPALKERDPELLAAIDARFRDLDAELDEHRTDGGFRLYTELSKDEVRDLTVRLDAVSEQVAKVAGVVAK